MKQHSLHPDTVLGGALVIFIFGIVAFAATSTLWPREKSAAACTEEAKVCPDGSAVTRTGPYCAFAPCLSDGLPNRPGITEEPLTVPAPKEQPSKSKKGIVCTQEVQTCADGSFVARTGPQCEFAPCPSDGEIDSVRD